MLINYMIMIHQIKIFFWLTPFMKKPILIKFALESVEESAMIGLKRIYLTADFLDRVNMIDASLLSNKIMSRPDVISYKKHGKSNLEISKLKRNKRKNARECESL